ncbi:hypothetical protein D3C83_76270 [compost metagenome]
MQLLEHLALLLGQVLFDTVEEQRGLVEQTIGRADVFHDDGVGDPFELVLLFPRQLAAGVDHDRDVGDAELVLHSIDELEAGHVG